MAREYHTGARLQRFAAIVTEEVNEVVTGVLDNIVWLSIRWVLWFALTMFLIEAIHEVMG